jgi:hypothetical protein
MTASTNNPAATDLNYRAESPNDKSEEPQKLQPEPTRALAQKVKAQVTTGGAEGTRTPDPHTARLSAARPSTFANVRTCRSEQVRPDFRTAADAGDLTWIYLNCYHYCAVVFISFDPLGPDFG